MIEYTCADCGKKFSSEGDYQQHQFLEEYRKLLHEVTGRQSEGLYWIASELRLLVIMQIATSQKLDFEAATRKYFDLTITLRKLWEEKDRKKIGNNDIK